MDQEGQLFDAYAQRDPSPVLNWLPIVLGFIASIIVALGFCPVPRSQTLSIAAALLLAATYVVGTVGVGVAVLAATGMIVARRGPEVSVWRVAPLFCAVAAWMTPTVAFYMRDSLWAASAAFVLSALGSRLIYRYHLTTGARAAATDDADFQISESSRARRISLTLAALLLNLGVLFIVVSVAHPAAILIGSSIGVISFVYESSAALNQLPLQSRFSKAVRFSITAGAAIILVGASLTPYLATYGGGTNPAHTGSTTQHSTASRSGRIGKPRARFLQSIASLLRRSEAGDTQSDTPSRPSDAASSARPYPTLQAIFGEGDSESGKESTSLKRTLKTTRATLLVAGDPEPGVILRPNIRDSIAIRPPSPVRRVFDGKPSERTTDPVSIPFYGAYWLFRASDKTLPSGSIEVRGDPTSKSFKTTDYSPISMEARQNFGSLINLSCCSAIELVISNGDRRPGTVSVELILTNTTLPGEPQQSLGMVPVNSTQRWFPGDFRPPVTEVLTFRLPSQPAIQSFDEATIRFELRSPREPWSALIAVERFRLIPRGF
jgi:hypothetical protein